MKRKALGKGLSALLPDPDHADVPAESSSDVPVDSLEPNPFQPRTVFEPARLTELAASLKETGMVQPILVRRHAGHGGGHGHWSSPLIADGADGHRGFVVAGSEARTSDSLPADVLQAKRLCLP